MSKEEEKELEFQRRMATRINWPQIVVALILAFLAYGLIMTYTHGSSSSDQGVSASCYSGAGC